MLRGLCVLFLSVLSLGCASKSVDCNPAIKTPKSVKPLGEPKTMTIEIPFDAKEPANISIENQFGFTELDFAWNKVVVAGNRWAWNRARGLNDVKQARKLQKAMEDLMRTRGWPLFRYELEETK